MFLGVLVHFFITVVILDGVSVASQECYSGYSGSDSCTIGDSIHYPFWSADSNRYYHCGYQGMSISCKDDRQVMNISNHLYSVQNIDYEDRTLRILDVDIEGSDCPQLRHNISLQSTALKYYGKTRIYYNCTRYPPQDEDYHHIPCLDHVVRNVTLRSFLYGNFDWYENCEETVELPSLLTYENSNYTHLLRSGFQLIWHTPTDSLSCENSGGRSAFNETTNAYDCYCYYDNERHCPHESGAPPSTTAGSQNYRASATKGVPTKVKVMIGVCAGLVASIVIIALSYRRVLFSTCYLVRGQSNVEVFLKNCGPLATENYKYSDIKKMTDSFKEKLGQGGFGSVFKGKITDGRLVAVKVLNDSKSNGEDFINEVATISRTNHVNVVNLVGFCSDGSKRALVYEFMPNGSLEKFIYNAKTSSTSSLHLGWEKLYQIALGIAKGLEYLHRGCNTRILHFDIKPHNILLDEDFCPKIADFGLAKLCPTKESIVSMLVARGTIGYIAPEVYCRNFGGVSHKSDVYSYGMMVLEMIGGRKNIDVSVENTSEIYFPQWIYNHFNLDVSVDGCGEIFEDQNAKKMITVSLWCIQTQPVARPSISKVVEMLEGTTEELEMPPNPFQDPPSSSSP